MLLFFFLLSLYSLYIINYFTVLLALYQLLLYKKSLLLQLLLLLASHFTDRANTHTHTHTYPIFCLFCFMVQSSRAIDKNEVLLTTTYHLLQWLSQYTSRVFGKILFCQTKMNSIDRIKEMVTTAFVYCTGL